MKENDHLDFIGDSTKNFMTLFGEVSGSRMLLVKENDHLHFIGEDTKNLTTLFGEVSGYKYS